MEQEYTGFILLNIGYAIHQGDWNYKHVNSPFARIYLVKEGTAKLHLPDKVQVLLPGHLYLIPPFTLHSYECDGHYSLYYIHIYEPPHTVRRVLEDYIFPTEIPASSFDAYLVERLMEINPERQLKEYDPSDYDNSSTLMQNIRRNLFLQPAETFETQGILLQLLSRFLKEAVHIHDITDNRIWKNFIPQFKAEKFDAHEWVSIFKAAGAKYVVPVAEHHDGFAMYDSDLNSWNAVKMGPKKDIIGLLKAETEKAGLVFGLSSHRLENAWFYNGGMLFPSDVQDTTLSIYGFRLPERDKYNDQVGMDWLAHTRELIDKYQPQLIWFDWTVGNEAIQPYFNKFMAYYYNNALDWGKGVVVNTKEGYPTNVQVGDVERGKLEQIRKYPWQTDTSVGKKSWAYIEGEENKTPEQIVHDLIDIVSKNGNLLLNIGPRADGTITEEQKAVLLAIGDWLKVNGEAIYGSRPWVKSGEGETKSTSGSFSDNTATAYTAQDIRFTTKGNTLYAIALNWSDQGITIHSLDKLGIGDSNIQEVSLLGSDEKITWKQTDKGLQVSFPKEKPCAFAYAFKITFDKMAGSQLENEMIDVPMVHAD